MSVSADARKTLLFVLGSDFSCCCLYESLHIRGSALLSMSGNQLDLVFVSLEQPSYVV